MKIGRIMIARFVGFFFRCDGNIDVEHEVDPLMTDGEEIESPLKGREE